MCGDDMRVRQCACLSVCKCACVPLCQSIRVPMCSCVRVHVCPCTRGSAFLLVCVSSCLCVEVPIRLCVCASACECLCVRVRVCVRVCVARRARCVVCVRASALTPAGEFGDAARRGPEDAEHAACVRESPGKSGLLARVGPPGTSYGRREMNFGPTLRRNGRNPTESPRRAFPDAARRS